MNVVFLSNYFTHHQKPLSDALAALADYAFIETEPMTEERLTLGWGMEEIPGYVCHYDSQPQRAEELLHRADAIITGSAPEKLVQECIRRKQLVLRYSERPLKKGNEWLKYFPRLVKWHLQNLPWKSPYLLCASAYTASDYARFGLFHRRTFRWGYFPETKRYENIDALLAQKQERSILWAGRFLDWKHPDDAVQVAARLKAAGVPFDMNIIGQGQLEEKLKFMIQEMQLQDCVHLLGSMKPEKVRQYMEQSQIFLFTSDQKEGWGAVLNEAMNSGCVVVASDTIGSVPYLLQDGENGCVYPSQDVEALSRNVRCLLENPEMMAQMGRSAYETILEEWNAENAAQKLMRLLESMLAGKDPGKLYDNGICSPAPLIGKDWYRK